MRNTAKFLTAVAFGAVVATSPAPRALQAQAPAQAPAQPGAAQPAPQQPGSPQQPFRVTIDLVTTDVIVRDGKDQFVADLKAGEFEVYEDGVKQDISSLVLIHGGRAFNVQSPPAP